MKDGGSDSTENLKPVEEVAAASMILVLAKKISSVSQTVSFLERRGFAAKIISSVTEAVDIFGKKEANILLLSVNFAHPKVEMLPTLMSQSFGIETILFAEESDRKSQSKLNNAKTKHVLFGPATGPVVLTKIRLIEREMNGSDEGQREGNSRSTNGRESEGDIKVGGRRGTGDDDTVVLNGRAGKNAAIDQLMKSLGNDVESNSDIDETSLERSGETLIQRGRRGHQKSAESGNDVESGELSAEAIAMRSAIDQGLQELTPDKRPRLLAANRQGRPGRAAGGLAQVPREPGVRSDDSREEPNQQEEKTSGAEIPAKLGALSESDMKPPTETSLEQELTASEKQALPNEEKLRRCMREALAVVAGSPTFGLSEMQSYRSAALISLRSKAVNCSFIIALHQSKKTAAELFHRVEVAFFSLLREYGLEFDAQDTFSIFLDHMQIVDAAFGSSDFVVVASTPDQEIGIAEVFTKNPVATLNTYEENMLRVEVDDIPLDQPITFNLFVHLKLNKKFIRYMKYGSILSSPQARRLENGHVVLLLDSQDREAYRRHCAAFAIQATPKKRMAA